MRPNGLAALVAALALAAVHAQAQVRVTALGKVVDAQTGEPIPDVTVVLAFQGPQPKRYMTRTDKSGTFVHVGAFAGPYKIAFSRQGYLEGTIDFEVRALDPMDKVPEFTMRKQVAPGQGAGTDAEARAGAALAAFKKEFNLAVELASAGRLDEAEAAYKEIIAKAPDIPEVHYNLGYVYRKKKDLANAEASFHKAIELDARSGDAYGALAALYLESGRHDQALDVAKRGTEQNPSDAKLQFNLGVLAAGTGRSEEARGAFLAAERLDAGNAEIQYQLGTLAVNAGETPDAIGRFERYLAMAPADAVNVTTAKALLAALKK